MPDVLTRESVAASMRGRFGTAVRYFDEIGSTNTEALQWASSGAPEGAVVVADHQTGGRGRWGRSWFSAPGKLLQFSLVLRPDIEVSRHGVVTAGLGVATARAIAQISGLSTSVKWPNDVLVNDKKVAGMLVETTVTGARIDAAVCGIGINVHLDAGDIPEELRDGASSIALEVARTGTGSVPLRSELLGRVVGEIDARYDAMCGGDADLMAEAAALSCVLGNDVVIRFADESTLAGRADGFDRDGGLRVESDGECVTVQVGEIVQLRTS